MGALYCGCVCVCAYIGIPIYAPLILLPMHGALGVALAHVFLAHTRTIATRLLVPTSLTSTSTMGLLCRCLRRQLRPPDHAVARHTRQGPHRPRRRKAKVGYQFRLRVRLAYSGAILGGWIEFDPATHNIPTLADAFVLMKDLQRETWQDVIEVYIKKTICFADRPRRYDRLLLTIAHHRRLETSSLSETSLPL